MFAFLSGTVQRRETDSVVIDVGGVGYEVYCTVRTSAKLAVGSKTQLHIHTAVSDDAIRLYGFASFDELRLFRLLIGVERIGPKAALAILGRSEIDVMTVAIIRGDAALLATVPGVGRKTAERLILELRDKLDWVAPAGGTTTQTVIADTVSTAAEGAVVALVGLGFKNEDARRAVAATDSSGDADTTSIVAAALRVLDTPA